MNSYFIPGNKNARNGAQGSGVCCRGDGDGGSDSGREALETPQTDQPEDQTEAGPLPESPGNCRTGPG